ncbi:MAG: nuclear transport factor 2 family protein [Acidobacteria bacterium]|nr:nuclear transport factor 2 family protein [Acidobacteriota bacterium]
MAHHRSPFESAVEQQLRRDNEAWVAALIHGDTATLARLMDAGCMFTYALEGDDTAQFIADIESGELQVAALKRDHVEVRIFGSTGVLLAHDEADWHYKGSHIQGHYRTMQVYAKREGEWYIVAVQASPIASQ